MKKWGVLVAFFIAAALSAQPIKTFQLTASENGSAEMSDGLMLPFWGFYETGGSAAYPGPRLIVNEGDSVRVVLYNAGSMAHTFHLHGFGSDTSNNGEPTNPVLVQPNNTDVFAFRAIKTGDYLYHCSQQNPIHGQMGMVGLLTVLTAGNVKKAYTGGPAYFKDYHWLLGEFDKEWHQNPPQPGSLPPFEPEYFFINGKYGDALGNYNTEDVAVFSAIDQLPVFHTVTHAGMGRREVIFPELVVASVVVRNGVPQIPPIIVDTLHLLPGESFGVMLQATSNGEDSIRVNYFAPITGALLHQNAAAIYFQHHSATSEAIPVGLFQIHPNPASGFLTIRFIAPAPKGISCVEIFSEKGSSMLRQTPFSDWRINVQQFPPGIYFLKIRGQNGQVLGGHTFIKN